VQSSPKRIFADPSLAVAGLRASPERLLKDLPAFGNIFENLCYRDLCVYADAVDAKVFHYRDDSDLEVDAIIESEDDRYGAFEIKLNPGRTNEGVRTLLRFREKMISRGNAKPACLVVLTGGGSCYTGEDGVSVVPVTALKE
jgi:predicted AAA+ superfamily ATPase